MNEGAGFKNKEEHISSPQRVGIMPLQVNLRKRRNGITCSELYDLKQQNKLRTV